MAFWSVETSKRALEYPIGYRVMLVPVVANRHQRPSVWKASYSQFEDS